MYTCMYHKHIYHRFTKEAAPLHVTARNDGTLGKCNQEARTFLDVGTTELQEYMVPRRSKQGFILNLCSGGNL